MWLSKKIYSVVILPHKIIIKFNIDNIWEYIFLFSPINALITLADSS